MKIFTRIILALLTVILAVMLTVTTLSSSLISCVRAHFTPQYVYNFMNSLDYASLELPDGSGNTAPLCDIINDQVRDFGIYFTENDLNDLIRTFRLDAVLTSYMQDVRSWALDDGPVPMLNAEEVAAAILSGLDPSLLRLLGLFGDPEEIFAEAINGMVSAADFTEAYRNGDMIRTILGADTMIFIISISCSIFLLILITRRLKLVPTAVVTGLTCIVSGSVMLFAKQILAPYKAQLFASGSADMLPEEIVDMVYLPFMETVHRTGTVISLGGLAALIVFAVVGTFAAMIVREKAASRRYAGNVSAMTGYSPVGFDGGFEYRGGMNDVPTEKTAADTSSEDTSSGESVSGDTPSADAAENEENHKDTEY